MAKKTTKTTTTAQEVLETLDQAAFNAAIAAETNDAPADDDDDDDDDAPAETNDEPKTTTNEDRTISFVFVKTRGAKAIYKAEGYSVQLSIRLAFFGKAKPSTILSVTGGLVAPKAPKAPKPVDPLKAAKELARLKARYAKLTGVTL